MRIVQSSDASQSWDCKKSVIEFDLSENTVVFDDSTQDEDPLADISANETNPPVSASNRISQTESKFETGSDSEKVTYHRGPRRSGRLAVGTPLKRL